MQAVKAFKNECRNYRYYIESIVNLDEKIDDLYDRLGGVRGVDPSREPLHAVPNKDLEWKLRADIDRCEARRSLLLDKVQFIDLILGKMEKSARGAVIAVYVDGETIMHTASQMYLSHNGLLKRMNKAIKKALED